MSIGWNAKLSLNVAGMRYSSDNIAKTAVNMSKLTMAGFPCVAFAIMLPTSARMRRAQKNYSVVRMTN